MMSENYSVGQNFDSFYQYPGELLLELVAGLLTFIGAVALLAGLSLYVLRAIGMYKLAKNRGLRCAWLAWVPVAGDWILGSISDQYQYVVKGRIRNSRFALLILSAITAVLNNLIPFLNEEVIVNILGRIMFGVGEIDAAQLAMAIVLMALFLLTGLAYMVLSFVAHFDLYRSCTKNYGVIYLVLSVFFRFLEPVFVFCCRNKDEGMPPRKAEPVFTVNEEIPVEAVQSEPAEQTEEKFEETPAEEEPVEE